MRARSYAIGHPPLTLAISTRSRLHRERKADTFCAKCAYCSASLQRKTPSTSIYFPWGVTKALNKELNLPRRNGVTGESLLKTLANLYHQHNMRAWADRQGSSSSHPIPKIVCSEALVVS